MENGITVFKVKVTTKVWNVSECLSGWYFLNHRTFCYQIFGLVMQHHEPESCRHFLLLLPSRSRSQQGLIWSDYDSFYYIIWTVDFLVTKLGLMIHHQKLECPMKKTGLLHSGSRWQWRVRLLMFVQMISSKSSNILFQTSYCDSSLSVRMSCKKIVLLFSRTRSLQELIRSKYLLYLLNCWSFCYQTFNILSELLILLQETWFDGTSL